MQLQRLASLKSVVWAPDWRPMEDLMLCLRSEGSLLAEFSSGEISLFLKAFNWLDEVHQKQYALRKANLNVNNLQISSLRCPDMFD